MDHWIEQEELQAKIAVVVPAFFSQRPSDELVRQLSWITLSDSHLYLPLENIWVIVDGDARTATILQSLQEEIAQRHSKTFNLIPLPENRGKLWVMRQGIQAVLSQRPNVEYILIRDGDGDHADADIPRLVRVAAFLAHETGEHKMIVIGSRSSRHRPMGWVRGELETMLDEITLNALAYQQAREGKALDLSYCGRGVAPDLSSGYKVYGREIAQALFADPTPLLCGLAENDYWHFGPETVTIVEGLLKGALLAEIPRLTWDGQPATSFGEFKLVRLYGALLGWVFARLEISVGVAAQMIDNVTPAMALRTTVEGRDLIDQVRQYALEQVRAWRQHGESIPPRSATLPFL